MTVFANRTGSDTLRRAFHDLANGVSSVRLASPFFSYAKAIEGLAQRASVYLVVRLGPATSARELGKVLEMTTAQVRYFTSSHFHTKLYLFGTKVALVGSANLTDAGMQSNREATVTISGSGPDFEELSALYESYWNEAHVLDADRLDRYAAICREHPRARRDDELTQALVGEFGLVLPSGGIQTGVQSPSKEKLYLEDYRRGYQLFEAAFRELRDVYEAADIRRAPELPLRIEIDQFINYVRDLHCGGDTYETAPLREPEDRKRFAAGLLEAWRTADWPYMHETIIPNYRIVVDRLGSPRTINDATGEELLEALEVCHAFKGRFRHFRGGLPTLRKDFLAQPHERIRRSLLHLIHSPEPYIDRMGALIFDSHFKLRECGSSVIQELLGWVNQDEVPICNRRTRMVLRFIGHDVPTE